jgi:hypothetical protein
MRIAALAILTTTAVLTAAPEPAPAQTYGGNYPVCAYHYRWGGSDVDCGYTTLAQCSAAVSGLSAQCVANPYVTQAPVRPDYRRYR